MGKGIAAIGALAGDPVRAAMLAALIDGRALPAGELAFIGNVAPQTASFHLGKMLEAALISVERQGKHSYYRLANEAVASALEAMAALAPLRDEVDARMGNRRGSEQTRELRFARTCYKHLAGCLAVQIHEALVNHGLLELRQNKECRLTEAGQQWFRQAGLLASRSPGRNMTGRVCLDWTQRRHHLGGPLGVELFASLKERGWVATVSGTRAVRLTHAGQRELQSRLGMAVRELAKLSAA